MHAGWFMIKKPLGSKKFISLKLLIFRPTFHYFELFLTFQREIPFTPSSIHTLYMHLGDLIFTCRIRWQGSNAEPRNHRVYSVWLFSVFTSERTHTHTHTHTRSRNIFTPVHTRGTPACLLHARARADRHRCCSPNDSLLLAAGKIRHFLSLFVSVYTQLICVQ